MYENLIKKYEVTKEEIENTAKLLIPKLTETCNTKILLAIADLLANGDIKEEKEKEGK